MIMIWVRFFIKVDVMTKIQIICCLKLIKYSCLVEIINVNNGQDNDTNQLSSNKSNEMHVVTCPQSLTINNVSSIESCNTTPKSPADYLVKSEVENVLENLIAKQDVQNGGIEVDLMRTHNGIYRNILFQIYFMLLF